MNSLKSASLGGSGMLSSPGAEEQALGQTSPTLEIIS